MNSFVFSTVPGKTLDPLGMSGKLTVKPLKVVQLEKRQVRVAVGDPFAEESKGGAVVSISTQSFTTWDVLIGRCDWQPILRTQPQEKL